MPPASRILQTNASLFPTAEPPAPISADSDVVVILAALLCALICVVGLALVARCACVRRSSGGSPTAPPSKGLKKKALKALPKVSYGAAAAASAAGGILVECPICLGEFAEGDDIRILPQCGHGFHVRCVDTWLAVHSSCPSCRRVLVVDAALVAAPPPPARCQRCGASSADALSLPPLPQEEFAHAREEGGANRLLP